ncbi:hypothetical protein HAX54_029835, partial [Datura stramonium]|nr:hypothetical protein [Datura stramonium]
GGLGSIYSAAEAVVNWWLEVNPSSMSNTVILDIPNRAVVAKTPFAATMAPK